MEIDVKAVHSLYVCIMRIIQRYYESFINMVRVFKKNCGRVTRKRIRFFSVRERSPPIYTTQFTRVRAVSVIGKNIYFFIFLSFIVRVLKPTLISLIKFDQEARFIFFIMAKENEKRFEIHV